MRVELSVGLLVVAMVPTVPTMAVAQSPDDQAVAEQLYQQGIALMKQGKYIDACPKLEASYEIDPAPGARLSLASCYEQTGRQATAWAHYRAVADTDRRQGHLARAKFAQQRAEALEPTIPRILITVSITGRISGLTVERDGRTVNSRLFDVPVYVDEGTYQIVAKAPGHQSFFRIVRARSGETAEVEIPRLSPRREVPEKNPVKDRAVKPKQAIAREPNAANQWRFSGLAAGVVGISLLATGLGYGWSARESWERAFSDGRCDLVTSYCSATGQDYADKARSRADTATVLVSAGGVLATVGTVLYLSLRNRDSRRRGIQVLPTTERASVGINIIGHFE